MPTILEQYRIADFLEWNREKRIKLNPDFQRGRVWTSSARIYLIDTILRELPIPKIYLRTIIDTKTQKSMREVVDGQQRLRAIFDFAADKYVLSKRAGEFEGLKYSSLDTDQQEVFLNYPISVGQLINSSDKDVLDIFARLNSYSVVLNAAEKRHALYQGDFKWSVRNSSTKWSILWETYGVLTVRQAVRMSDDSLFAEMYGLCIEGLIDGGQQSIDKLYKKYDENLDINFSEISDKIDNLLSIITSDSIIERIENTPIIKSPHFFMIVAAFAYVIYGIDVQGIAVQDSNHLTLRNPDEIAENLLSLSAILDSERPDKKYEDFWTASKSSTQRIKSRRIRFPYYLNAISEDN